MAARRWTDEQQAEALALHRSHGPAEASRLTGIPKGTIASWARRQGVETNAPVEREAAVESAVLAAEQRRLDLANNLLGDVQGLRRRLFAPIAYAHVKTVNGGKDAPADVETVWVDCDQPVPADQLRLVQAVGVLIDKVQLLTGEATERHDFTGEYDLEAELRAYQQGLADRGTVKG